MGVPGLSVSLPFILVKKIIHLVEWLLKSVHVRGHFVAYGVSMYPRRRCYGGKRTWKSQHALLFSGLIGVWPDIYENRHALLDSCSCEALKVCHCVCGCRWYVGYASPLAWVCMCASGYFVCVIVVVSNVHSGDVLCCVSFLVCLDVSPCGFRACTQMHPLIFVLVFYDSWR